MYLFLFKVTATTEIYTCSHTLSLHDVVPSCVHGAPIGAGNDAPDAAGGQALPGLARLTLAFLGELRVDDAGVDARLGEVNIEVGLAMANQDHGRRLRCGGSAPLPALP